MSFVHLHVHSDYSLLDGAASVDALARRAKELKQSALALTDHGNLHGAVAFQQACLKQAIRPILGMEAYIAPGSRQERQSKHGLSDAAYHLILLAETPEGWANLARLSSIGYLQGFYYRPRIDKEVLARHRKGLICLSGCLGGELASLILKNELPLARTAAESFLEIFGKDHYFLEIQDQGLPEQARVNRDILQLGQDLGIRVVATNDSHYAERDMAEAHDAMLCVQTAARVSDRERMRFGSEEYYLKSEQEMRAAFAGLDHVIDASGEIAGRCHAIIETGKPMLPEFTPPADFKGKAAAYLQELCQAGLERRYPAGEALRADAEKRLAYELGIIEKLGFEGYFLVVQDFISWARKQGIRVGPGRGSAAGSLASYCLGITQLDPLERGLLFERFLNPERVSPPDIDVDFEDGRRHEVIEYVARKYGRERVASVATFGTMQARAALRDVGRVLDYSYGEVDVLAKMVPGEPGMTLSLALERSAEFKAAASEARPGRLINLAKKLEGMNRNLGTHAAGIVIAPRDLFDCVPLCLPRDSEDQPEGEAQGLLMTQFDMASLEKVGLLKVDFLGLRTLSVIEGCLKLLKEAGQPLPDVDKLPDRDSEVFAMLSKGESHGVFQLESSGMRDLLRRFKPACLEDLDQLIALYRPGPMRMIDEYLRRREGKDKASYEHPLLEAILSPTQGVIVYQEQVMRVAVELAGFSLAQADLLRRAMAKKDEDLLERQRERFHQGSSQKGLKPDASERVFDLLKRFAEYGFNKSHSAAYAQVAYQTAWLKAHHPQEFFCALLTSELGDSDRLQVNLAELKRQGLAWAGPHINASQAGFTAEKEGLRLGLAVIKGLGWGAAEALAKERASNGAYHDLEDLLRRSDTRVLPARAAESLIKAGALDGLGATRASLLASLPLALDRAVRDRDDRVSGQVSLFEAAANAGPREDPKLPEWQEPQLLAFEKEALGFYLSGHPLDRLEAERNLLRPQSLASLLEARDGAKACVAGLILGVKQLTTKRQEAMARVTLEDASGICELLIWPRAMDKARPHLKKDALIAARGKVDQSGEQAKLSVEDLEDLALAPQRWAKGLHLALPQHDESASEALMHWLRQHSGSLPVYLHWRDGRGELLQKLGTGHGIEFSADARSSLAKLEGLEAWIDLGA